MDSRKALPGRPENNRDWIERLQWLGIKVEKPLDKSREHTARV